MESTRKNLPERLRWFHRNPQVMLAAPIVEAADEIDRLRDLIRTLVENDPQEPISDGGHVVLDLWRHEARQALGIES